jgi:Spy/CpxP family protein refolding chaperone
VLPKSKVYAVLLLLAVAAAGFAAGVATSGLRRHSRQAGRDRGGFSSWLSQQLDLSGSQTDTVRAILQRYRPAMREVFQRVRPQMDSLRDRMDGDIRAALTETQRVKFDSLLRAQRLREDSMAQRRPGRP